MALKGTLKDFGIADIFQLIGHQSKTGVLTLRRAEKEVRITFKLGNVISADTTTRDKRELLGAMLVRAELITEEQLQAALEQQQRTLKRLGDILKDSGVIQENALKDFSHLQTTETIYKLFLWNSGTYEFTQQEEDEVDAGLLEPIRSENVLMEGFRMVDEWPMIRNRIPSYAVTFRILKPLPEPRAKKKDDTQEKDFLSTIDEAFAEAGADPKSEKEEDLGAHERSVYKLVTPGRTVQKIIDKSRLGEFETCKALYNLVEAGLLAPLAAPQTQGAGLAEGGALEPESTASGPTPVQQALSYAFTAALALAILVVLGLDPGSLLRTDRLRDAPFDGVRTRLGEQAYQRVERAVEVYRLVHGQYPSSLDLLVEQGLLKAAQLRYPFERPFSYVRRGDTYILVRPFY